MLEQAVQVMEQAHEGQLRKLSGFPYADHPRAVARLVNAMVPYPSPEIGCAALLHDVVEDSDVTLEDLERDFGPHVAQIVDLCTHHTKDKFQTLYRLQRIDQSSQLAEDAWGVFLSDKASNARDIYFGLKGHLAEAQDPKWNFAVQLSWIDAAASGLPYGSATHLGALRDLARFYVTRASPLLGNTYV